MYQRSANFSDLRFGLQNTQEYLASAIINIHLYSGNNYTSVIGASANLLSAYFGLFIIPTRAVTLGNDLNFVVPEVPLTGKFYVIAF